METVMRAGKRERLVFVLGFVFKQSDDQWASICPEMNVASYGADLDEARQGLQSIVEAYVTYTLAKGRTDDILRPLKPEDLDDILSEPPPPGADRYECYVLIVTLPKETGTDHAPTPAFEFLRSEDCPQPIVGHMAAG